MKRYTYRTDEALPPETPRLVRGWADRRRYPIEWGTLRGADHAIVGVVATLDAPSTGEHNRAVDSLARILDRAARTYARNLA